MGLSEEDAIKSYGKDDIEVYHSFFQPLEYALTDRDSNKCYGKLVCVKSEGVRNFVGSFTSFDFKSLVRLSCLILLI